VYTIIAVAALGIGSYTIVQSQAIETSSQKQISYLSASWDEYSSFKNLAGNSTNIVSGKVMSVNISDMKNMIPTTDFNFQIDHSVKGDLKQGDVIVIRQTGAEGANLVTEVHDDPLLKEGDSIFGFLRYSAEHDIYVIVGGPQGRFIDQGNQVSSLDSVNENASWIPIKVRNAPIESFEQQVKAEASS
jgi:hypothetical protein